MSEMEELTILGDRKKWGDRQLRAAMEHAGVLSSDFESVDFNTLLAEAKRQQKEDPEAIASLRMLARDNHHEKSRAAVESAWVELEQMENCNASGSANDTAKQYEVRNPPERRILRT
eukprot:SAG11_NODE_8867_length_968_cov_1.284235_1_plen_117_part_00